MTTAREASDTAAAHARKVKDEHVRQVKGKRDRTDIATVIEAFRDGEPVAYALTLPHRDTMLAVAEVLANGLGADLLALTFEAYAVIGSATPEETAAGRLNPETNPSGINPDTGQRWGEGEMGAYFAAHGPDGVVSEALNTTVATRAGDVWMFAQPYRIEGTSVTWDDRDNFDSNRDTRAEASGYVPRVLREVMTKPTVLQQALRARPDFADMSTERLLANNDAACVKYLPHLVAQLPDPEAFINLALFAIPGSVRHQVLVERLGRGDVTDPRRWAPMN